MRADDTVSHVDPTTVDATARGWRAGGEKAFQVTAG
jgi:hypothetical protein